MKSRNAAGVYVGADHARMTMHTKPLSPSIATSNPDSFKTLIVARSETLAGAALLANAISASCGIMYSLSGGYCVWPWTEVSIAAADKSIATPLAISFQAFASADSFSGRWRISVRFVLIIGITILSIVIN